MTRFETLSLWVTAVAALVTLLAVVAAIWGERIRQLWSRPKLELGLLASEGELNTRQDQKKARYYSLVVRNKRASAPASNVRVLLLGIKRKGADGRWYPVQFSAPVQVSWRWPNDTPRFTTVGPDECATFAYLVQEEASIQFQLYWYPNNLDPTIHHGQPTRLVFRAVSDAASSAQLVVEMAWDGKWAEDASEMAKHLNVRIAALSADA